MTLTETGITLKLKRHRSGIGMSWDQVIAAAGVKLPEGEMLGDLAEGLKKLGVKETA